MKTTRKSFGEVFSESLKSGEPITDGSDDIPRIPRIPRRVRDDLLQNIGGRLPRGLQRTPGDDDGLSERSLKEKHTADIPKSKPRIRKMAVVGKTVGDEKDVLSVSEEKKSLDSSDKADSSPNVEGVVDVDATADAGQKDFSHDVFEISDTSRKSIEEHTQETGEAMKNAFGSAEILSDDQKVSPPHKGYFGSPEYKQVIDDQSPDISATQRGGIDWEGVKKDFDEEGKRIQEERVRSVKFNRLDAQETFDEETEKLKNHDKLAERFRDVKNFDELLVLLSDPEFPGIQGSKQFYSGDDLKRIIAIARETGATNFATRSHGFLDMVERLLREEKEGKMGALKEDDIVEGFGVVDHAMPSVLESALEISNESHEEKENNPAHAVESLEELQERVDRLKNDADAARNLLFSCRRKNGDQWKRVKKFFSFPKEKETPKPVIEEWEMLEVAWKHKLTLYKDARVELAKRKVAEEGSQGKDIGAVMAETIQELDFRGRVENYNAWKDVAWSGKKDSWLLRAVGRAKDWSESYRQLDWKKRAAISALVFGAGATGVAVGSVGLVGLGAASGVAVRLLGSYAAGRGLYEYLEGRENKNAVKFHEAALSHVEQSDDLGFLDHRTRDYADRMQKDFERMTQKNRKRVWAGVAAGALLFAGGTAFSLAHVASAAERLVDGGDLVQTLQETVVAKSGGISPMPSVDTVGEAITTARSTVASPMEGISVPNVAEVSVPVSDTSGLMAGMKIAAVPRGGSFEGVLIEKLMGVGVAKEEAGKLVHQAMLDLADKSGRPFEIFNHIQPGAEIQYEIGPDKSLSVFGVTREAGGRAIQRIADSTLEGGHASSVAQTLKESLPLSPKPADAVPVPSVQMPYPDPFPKMPEVNLESPQDIFERVLPKVPQAPSLEDTLSGNVSLDASVSAPSLEALPVEASAPVHDFESLDISVPGGEYLKNIGTVVKERLTFLPLSETQKDLIENIFSARIPTAGTEPTTSSVLFVRDALGKALFSSGDVERWMRVDIEQVRERVNKAVYAGLVRIGGESLRIKEMVAEGETVKGWLTKMARHILTHPIEPAK